MPPKSVNPIKDFKRCMQFFPRFYAHRAFGHRQWPLFTVTLLLLSLSTCTRLSSEPSQGNSPHDHTLVPTKYDCEIAKTLPHSDRSFTQGLVVDGNDLIESSGLYGKSFIHRYPISGDEGGYYKPLPDSLFAESLTLIDGKLFLLTWKSGRVLVLDPDTLSLMKTLSYQGEGWGLTHLNHQLIMSNGSNQLTFRNPNDFSINRSLNVFDNQRPLNNLNDLTVAYGLIWANVWHAPYIAAIDPDSGQVVAKLDCRNLTRRHRSSDRDNVLNGIAWDEKQQGFWVTGKRWNKRYLIQLETPPSMHTTPTVKK